MTYGELRGGDVFVNCTGDVWVILSTGDAQGSQYMWMVWQWVMYLDDQQHFARAYNLKKDDVESRLLCRLP